MRIASIDSRVESFELSRPYSIAYKSVDAVDNVIVEVRTESGEVGLGAASPAPYVTGETDVSCRDSLGGGTLDWLVGKDVRTLPALCRCLIQALPDNPAARAAVDVALHDLYARSIGLPLVEVLGRAHDSLPTSITIGIRSVEETLEEAREYIGRGFVVIKVKVGKSLTVDLERLHRLRETVGAGIGIRVDANQGYTRGELLRFVAETEPLGIELIEQPLLAADIHGMRSLPERVRRRIAADESLLAERHALELSRPPVACGIYNIKLMKCGGIHSARRIADVADAVGIDLMWGCNDESVISIAGALHVALACPATRYLDLDGSLDLARDVAAGGFRIDAGRMYTIDAPGLGLRSLD